jgi:hypothetical protein
MVSPYDVGDSGACLCGAQMAEINKALAVTLPQVGMVLAMVMLLRDFDRQLALDILAYQ